MATPNAQSPKQVATANADATSEPPATPVAAASTAVVKASKPTSTPLLGDMKPSSGPLMSMTSATGPWFGAATSIASAVSEAAPPCEAAIYYRAEGGLVAEQQGKRHDELSGEGVLFTEDAGGLVLEARAGRVYLALGYAAPK